ncbi:hypothetical protein [Polaribacter porphyrae]|uniref:hypothetical protein n=1 Tax=Polaribacter porphyrae TaxID=1137780 RepID=UPI001D000F94|nr:hypothetical protein [Polaribacter porphyrae]
MTQQVLDISEIKPTSSTTFKEHVSVVCFLGNDIEASKTRLFNLNEKIYKKFFDYKNFQIVAFYPEDKYNAVINLKKEIGTYTDMQKWIFTSASKEEIEGLYDSFSYKSPLENLGSTKAFLIDKNASLRGRTNDEDTKEGKLYGYNLNSISELNDKLKDDLKVLYYEYYAAFKERNKNKADRKEVGL